MQIPCGLSRIFEYVIDFPFAAREIVWPRRKTGFGQSKAEFKNIINGLEILLKRADISVGDPACVDLFAAAVVVVGRNKKLLAPNVWTLTREETLQIPKQLETLFAAGIQCGDMMRLSILAHTMPPRLMRWLARQNGSKESKLAVRLMEEWGAGIASSCVTAIKGIGRGQDADHMDILRGIKEILDHNPLRPIVNAAVARCHETARSAKILIAA